MMIMFLSHEMLQLEHILSILAEDLASDKTPQLKEKKLRTRCPRLWHGCWF